MATTSAPRRPERAPRTSATAGAAPAQPLGSLLQRSARPSCPSCGADALTELSLRLTDGTAVRFSSCRRCQHRQWSGDGDDEGSPRTELSISTVLERTRAV